MKRIWKRKVMLPLLLAIIMATVGCSKNGGNEKNVASGPVDSQEVVESNNASESAEEAVHWTGTITMFAQSYTPESEALGTINQHKFREVADEYESTHPGIKIEFVDEAFKDYNQTVRIKAASSELWDVFWAQWADLNNTFPKGIAVDLTPYFEQPNPYAKDAATWLEAMNQTIVKQTASPDGKHYNINADYVATAFFYNKDMFDKAGITETPKTWKELLETSKKLQSAGLTAFSQVPDYGWFQRHFLSDFYTEEFDTLVGYDKNPGLSGLDQAIAIKKGVLSTKDERFMAWWPTFKELTDTWKKDYLTADPGVAAGNARNDFLAGKSAILYDGSWLPNIAKSAKATFALGSFNFPQVSPEDNPFSKGMNTSGAVGGPGAAYQYAISTEMANSTMKEPGKKEAVLDWLHFVGSPGNVEKIVNENGTFIPTWPNTKPAETMSSLASQAEVDPKAILVGDSTPDLGKGIQRVFGLYLAGNIDLDKAKEIVQKELDKSTKDYETNNKVDLSTY